MYEWQLECEEIQKTNRFPAIRTYRLINEQREVTGNGASGTNCQYGFNHAHASQLNMYLEYCKKYGMAQGDNPPVGILLCTGKDQEYVEFATAGLDDQLFVAKYLVALPDKKELEDFIRMELSKR
ncbi:MAG: DUF1016 family protein [Williamsia sp.]|nr:DUF1016 family protein [Williamsia sp.]